MRYRPLAGGRLPDVSVVALGTMSVAAGAMHPAVEADRAARTIRQAVECGINLIDTAPSYGDGESEARLGNALRDGEVARERIVIATKASGPTLSRAEILADCESSLARLRTDYIDLYQLHWRRDAVPMSETFDALHALQRSGKVREIGVCNFGPRDLRDAWSVGGMPVTDQVAYSLLSRGVEFALAPLCVERGIGLLCYSPLAQGMLTGKYRTIDALPPERCRARHFAGARPMSRHGEPGCEPALFAALDALNEIAGELNCTMSDLAIAWLLRQPAVTSVLCGASTPEQVQANVRAVDLHLDAQTLDRLDVATAAVKAHLGDNLDLWQGRSNSRIH